MKLFRTFAALCVHASGIGQTSRPSFSTSRRSSPFLIDELLLTGLCSLPGKGCAVRLPL